MREMAYVGCLAFNAGEPDRELVINKPEGFVIMVPQDRAWEACIEECFPTAKKVSRYAIKKDTRFDKAMLRNMVAGASSYTRYNEGIEIEVDTVEEERRKGLATIASAALIRTKRNIN